MTHLPLRQTEGLMGSVIGLLGLALAVPDHSTLCRRRRRWMCPAHSRAETAKRCTVLVDSTGLKLCGAGEWLAEKHGAKTRRSWRKLHIGLDADTGQIVAAALTAKEIDDGTEVGPLLDQVPGPLASTTRRAFAQSWPGDFQKRRSLCHCVPRRCRARRRRPRPHSDLHLNSIGKHGRTAWQNTSGYTKRARVEAAIGRFKQVIGDGLRSRTDGRRAIEVKVAVHVLNRMMELGRPMSVRIV
jgi:hypothetical protein